MLQNLLFWLPKQTNKQTNKKKMQRKHNTARKQKDQVFKNSSVLLVIILPTYSTPKTLIICVRRIDQL